MHVITACPDFATLERFVLGGLDAPALATLEEHITCCDGCADRMAQVDTTAGLLTLVGRRSAVLEGVDPGHVNRFLAGLRQAGFPETREGEFGTRIPSPVELGRLGRYRVIRELGRGGMGIVYEADDSVLCRRIALKVLHENRAGDPHYQARFQREAGALARLSHPNIVPVFETSADHGRTYLAMELVRGSPLSEHLQGQPLPPTSAADLVATLAEAVHYAHHQGVIHRDLKPGNILLGSTQPAAGPTWVTSSGAFLPKVVDFGLARHLDEVGMTMTGDLLGTPGYMAPEMTRGRDTCAKDSPTVDVYALGAILYEMLTGRPPFRGASVADTLEQVRKLDALPPRRLQPTVPHDLETICLKCLEKHSGKRYPTAGALADDLRRFLAGRSILARPAGPIERAVKWARRQPGWAAVIASTVLAAVALAGVAVRYEQSLRRAATAAEQSAEDARHEQEHARANYREARSTLEKMLGRASEPRRGDLPRVRELRKDLQEDALAFYLAVAAQGSDPDPEVRWDAAQARLQASLLQIQLGRPVEARENLCQAADLTRSLSDEHPAETRYRRAYAEALMQQGIIASADEAGGLLREALSVVEGLHAADPAVQQYRNDLARICHALGQSAQPMQQGDLAQRYYLRAIDIRRDLLAERPDWREPRFALGQTQVNLLLIRQAANAPDIDALSAEAAVTLEEVVALTPDEPTALIALAGLRTNWAYVLMGRGQLEQAATDLGRPIDLLERFVAREPEWSEARRVLRNARGTRALALDRRNLYAAAAADYRRVVALSSSDLERKPCWIDWAALLLRAGDLGAAATETFALAADSAPLPNPGTLQQHLRTCASLATVGLWGYRPLQDGAFRAARAVLEQTRKDLSPDTFARWLKAVRKAPDMDEFLNLPEFRDSVR